MSVLKRSFLILTNFKKYIILKYCSLGQKGEKMREKIKSFAMSMLSILIATKVIVFLLIEYNPHTKWFAKLKEISGMEKENILEIIAAFLLVESVIFLILVIKKRKE